MNVKATISVSGIGPVVLDTERKEVKLVGGVAKGGSFVNVKTKRVSRSAAATKRASAAYRKVPSFLVDLGGGHFKLEVE